MSKGVLYKCNGTTWSKSQAKDTSNTTSTWDDGKIMHCNGITWYDNYPMEQLYDQYFNVTWTHGYNGSGVKLDEATWGNHPRSGDTIDFIGLWGFDRVAMRNFVSNGIVQDIQIQVMFDDPTAHSGSPIVNFFPHTYTAMPDSYSGMNANTNYTTQSTFVQTGSDFTRWVVLPVGAWLNTSMGGIVCRAPSAIGSNSCRFAGTTTSNGLNAYNTRLWIQVLK